MPRDWDQIRGQVTAPPATGKRDWGAIMGGAQAQTAPAQAEALVEADGAKKPNVLSSIFHAPSRFAGAALNQLTLNKLPGLLPKPEPAQNLVEKAAEVTGRFTGEALPFIASYGTIGKAVGSLPKIAKAGKLTQLAAKGAAASGAVGGVEAAIEGKGPAGIARQAGLYGALGAVGDPLLEGVAAPLVKKGLQKVAPKLLKRVTATPKAAVVKEAVQEAPVAEIKPQQLKDISGFRAYTSDVYRNFKDVYGKNYEAVKKRVLDPFDAAKKANVDMQEEWTNKLKTEVVNKLGIKKNSNLSALVQQYGEKKITLDELKQAAPDDWQKVADADKWFRKAYDQLLDEVNAVREKIYPNVEKNIAKIEVKIEKVKADQTLSATEKQEALKVLEGDRESAFRGKRIPKRQDYYRHFRELSDTFAGVKNLFETPAAIDPSLAGISDFTKPGSKFLSFAQKRGLGPFKNDAVGGFLDYIQAASYAKHIDPQIGSFRGLAKELAEGTTESKNVNQFIEYLQDFANDLAGKTSPFDRAFQKVVPGGRTTIKAIDWLNRRVKANVILGNVGSSLSQLANIPQGIAFTKQYAAPGVGRTIKNIFPQLRDNVIKQSGFLKERFADKMYRQFDTKWFQQPKNFAIWMLETTDRIGTEFIWNSAYEKALAESIAEPIKYADDIARRMVAGRGIGEMPLIQKSKLFQIIAPFQVEVANLWQVQRDFVKEKDFGALATLYLANWLFNQGMERTRGSGVVFDPIEAFTDALSEEDISPLQRGGRLAGEVLSNVPLGQTIAAAYPEYGGNVLGAKIPSRRELFGRTDPTRFGGGPLMIRALQNPLSRVALPYGGLQLEKTIKSGLGLRDKGVYTGQSDVLPYLLLGGEKGGIKYPVQKGPAEATKGLLFGPSAFSGANEFYDKNRRPLTEKQTLQVEKTASKGYDKSGLYEKVQLERRIETVQGKMSEVRKNKELTKEERLEKLQKLNDQRKELLLQRKDVLQKLQEKGGQ